MKTTSSIPSIALLATLLVRAQTFAAPDPNWLDHDRARPLPPVVKPGTPSTPDKVGTAPSDAVVLFDGKDLSQWVDMDGKPTKWIMRDGYMECVRGSGYVRTLQNFGDCQLHVEWATPKPAHGEGQGRGNSGVFFGRDRYEVQVLDCYENKTYADGSAGSIYGQYPPLVNVCRPPGEWQTYDILYTAPRFDGDKLLSSARITAFHNGVLIQNNVELTGPTAWVDRAPYSPHPEKQPIAFQDHGNPVRYRNVWVRELGTTGTETVKPAKPQLTLKRELLDSYAGKYEHGPEVKREGDNLTANIGGVNLTFFAESQTKFSARTTDVQLEFKTGADGKVTEMIWSVGEGANTVKRAN